MRVVVITQLLIGELLGSIPGPETLDTVQQFATAATFLSSTSNLLKFYLLLETVMVQTYMSKDS